MCFLEYVIYIAYNTCPIVSLVLQRHDVRNGALGNDTVGVDLHRAEHTQ